MPTTLATRIRQSGLALTLASGLASGCADEHHDPASARSLAALTELANSPEIMRRNTPFADAPQPDHMYYVPMSDGTRIALNMYLPAGAERTAQKLPTVFVESWYGRVKEAFGIAIALYTRAGFAVAISDARGFGASFGSQGSFSTERARADHGELLSWLAAQPWSDGRTLAVGHSLSGDLAEQVVASSAPSLKGAVIRAAEQDQYAENVFPGGAPNLRILGLVADLMDLTRGADCVADLRQCASPLLGAVNGDLRALQAAYREHAGNLEGAALARLVHRDDRLGSGTFADFSAVGHLEARRSAAVPARISASWLDGTTAAAALARFDSLPELPMELVIGATTHSGALDADPFSRTPFEPAQPAAEVQYGGDVEFLQRVLDGAPIGRSVHYYVLGAGAWKSTPVWPPAGVAPRTLALGDRALTPEPSSHAGAVTYRVDPRTSSGAGLDRWASQVNTPIFYGDRRAAPGERLHFDTAPLEEDRELVGAPELCLRMRSDQTDGLLIATLEDVAPDGRVTYLTEGVLRLLHRNTRGAPCDPAPGVRRSFERADAAAVVPGERMSIELPLLPVAARIEKGHAIRLSLAGADQGTFPLLTPEPATWSIDVGGSEGSTLQLPTRPWTDGT